jgi:hypothetical protein
MGKAAMSQITEASPVLRLCSCLTAKRALLSLVEAALESEFGAIARRSEPFAFDTSDYYRDEMGTDLERYWYCFRELFPPEQLPESRLSTGRIEERFMQEGGRRVNLDPGYLDHGKLVLASMKEAPDKIYLGRGVWAHTCLRYHSGGFVAPDHSFPDFKDGRFNGFMLEARALYKTLKATRG